MKAKVYILFVLVVLLAVLYFYSSKPVKEPVSIPTNTEEEVTSPYKTFTYVITDIKGNDYYGESIDGKTKIVFNKENVKVPIDDSIQVNDRIKAYVESENHVEGIIKIEKIK
ncbi:hypothetical protein CHH83_20745 [Bacillus sp. 7586-K]|uniref:hypothetical protein n=1 Tax=Metabacillus niabensis TaxID=324854 RepID=UPI000BA7D497|nr:hypothetical protein CHH83_20745 [Bacillus sp. 7586-K]